MKSYVLGFAFDMAKRHVALIQKNRPAWQNGLWNGIGGKIEPKELAVEAMSREFSEETGVVVPSDSWRLFLTMNSSCFSDNRWTIHCYSLFSDQIFDVTTKTDERVSVFPADTLPLNRVANLDWLVPMAKYQTDEYYTGSVRFDSLRATEMETAQC